MPDFFPFRGIRYRGFADLSPVIAPPYDVIEEDERVRLEEAHPHNAVRLILPRAERGHDAYTTAADTWQAWRASGVLEPDPVPSFYRYVMQAPPNEPDGADGPVGPDRADGPRDVAGIDAGRVTGVIGALVLPSAEGEVFGHEHTLARARADRLELLRATRANLDPIWCLSLGSGMTDVLSAATADEAPRSAVDAQRVTHELSPLRGDDAVAAITAAVAMSPLVVADGHHRYETARTYRAEHPDDPGAAAVMAFVVELDERCLHVRAIHRILRDAPADLRSRLRTHFSLRELAPNTPARVEALTASMRVESALGLVDAQGLALLVPTTDGRRDDPTVALPALVRGVDAARFDALVAPLVQGSAIDYRDDAAFVADVVRRGGAPAAVLLRPPTVEEIRAVALAGQRMPQKTTYFAPKPRTGMVFRTLEQ